MSKVSLGGSPTGTATFDIVAPATNTNRTITLPDVSDTLMMGPLQVVAAINFNGTGTVAARSSYNLSVSDPGGTGVYALTFGTAQPDTNYLVIATGGSGSGSFNVGEVVTTNPRTVNGFRVAVFSTANTAADIEQVSVIVLRINP